MLPLSLSLLRKFLVTRHIYTKKIKTRKRYVLRTFFLCFATRTLRVRCAFVRREREREEEESLFLSNNARIWCCISFFFISRKMRNLVSRKGHKEGWTSFSESRFG